MKLNYLGVRKQEATYKCTYNEPMRNEVNIIVRGGSFVVGVGVDVGQVAITYASIYINTT